LTRSVETNRRVIVHTFETPGRTTIEVRASAGHVTVATDDTERTTVELTALNSAGEDAVANARVEQRGSTVVVDFPRNHGLFRQSPSVGVTLTCPHGSSLDLQTGSSDIRASGTYSTAVVATGSGDIELETVTGSAKLKSGSGAVSAGRVDQALVATAGSGDISIGELAGDVVIKSGSGDVEVGRLGGTLLTKSGSGSLTVRRATSGAIRANGASGDISIGIEEGTAAWLDVSTVSGRVHQELEDSTAPADGQHRVEITARTVSGDLRVHRS
jgi:DUF4097 and DUF4098 domain-containing protein YvlB